SRSSAAAEPDAGHPATSQFHSIPGWALQFRRCCHHARDPALAVLLTTAELRSGSSTSAALRDPASTATRTPRRSHRPTRTPPPTARAHPTRHSYADSPLGPPTSAEFV